MAKFFNVKVSDVRRETVDSVSLALDIPAEAKDAFKYTQGQYITFKVNVNGEELRRSYSICSSPVADSEIRVAVKKVEGGKVSTYFNESLKVGDELPVMPPMGNFNSPLNSSNKKHYVLFAGGSGITPMISILKTSLEVETQSKVTLFYGNQDEEAIIFKSELDKLAQKYQGRLNIHHILNEPKLSENKQDSMFVGIMMPDKNKALLQKFVNMNEDIEIFICGPAGMMASVEETCNLLKVDKKRVHLEYFTAPADTSETVKSPGGAEGSTFESKVKIISDGEEYNLTLGADDVILDAALDANIDAPYACRGGSCCTCRAKLLEGKVVMKVNYALL
ncbi:MAG: 2Fe-2S iron-sulfur cluster binding domain-containing protein, partial [Bacteroidetes bacterium]|nr:2Fe-2S iron-sulfur cluster binding domain-containing protein [Bacteroidota bacterium]